MDTPSWPSRRSIRKVALAAVLVLAIVLRLLFVLSDHGDAVPPDGMLYSNIAVHILEGDGYTQDARSYFIIVPPAYPTFLALVYGITGSENTFAILTAQTILSVLTVLLVYFIGSDLAGSLAGLVGAALFSIHWVSIYFVGFVLTETMFTLFTALLAWLLLRSFCATSNRRLSVIVGVVLGVACLCRPHFLFFIPIAFLIFGLLKRKAGIRSIVVSTSVALLVIAPWITYVSVQQGRLVPVASYGGMSVWIGNSRFTNPNVYYHSRLYANNPEFQETMAEAETLEGQAQDAFYREKAIQFIVQEPLRFVSNTWSKWLLFWKPVTSPLSTRTTTGGAVGRLSDRLLVILGVIGSCVLLASRHSRSAAFLLLSLILYYSGLVSVNNIVATGRYRLPIMPLMAAIGGAAIVLAAWSLVRLSKPSGSE